MWNHIICRLFRPRDYWHNRHFDSRYQAREESPGRWAVTWRGQPVASRPLADLAGPPQSRVCHIIASGPSWLAVREPARLFNDYTICLNGSYRVAAQVGKPCDLFVTFDAGFARRRFQDFKQAVPCARRIMIDHLVFFLIFQQDAELAQRLNPFLYDDPNRPFRARAVERAAWLAGRFSPDKDYVANPDDGRVLISKSAQIGVASNASVVCLALQAAWLMGFPEVRIYGMDLGGAKRFYNEGAKAERTQLDERYESHLLPWFTAFAKNLCGPSFRVFNCSETSRLPAEILPRLDPNAPVT